MRLFPSRFVRRWNAFTLVEVLLAIVIAIGILVVLLYYYQQATNLRSQAIQETERLAAARLIMDRITGELATLQTQSASRAPLVGSSNSIDFIKADLPSFAAWNGGALGRAAFPVTDLKRVQYRLNSAFDTNSVSGLWRSEEPWVLRRESASAEDDIEETNTVGSTTTALVLEEIQFLQFRFWTGTNWVESWNQLAPPKGVEVSLGAEALTNAAELVDYPGDLFRRVIALRASASPNEAAGLQSSMSDTPVEPDEL